MKKWLEAHHEENEVVAKVKDADLILGTLRNHIKEVVKLGYVPINCIMLV